MQNKKTKVYILLFFIIVLGFFLRIYNIDNAPPGVYPDEAVNGEDALRALNTGNFQWFYPANQGREGLMMNLVALCFKFFGASILSLKLPAIVFGTLTILGAYLLGKELFNTRVGLISSFLVSVGYWAINFNRISFRANLLPFVLVFSFYFLWKGLRTKNNWDFIFGGLFFGLGLHTYIAFRIAPAILIVTLISLIASRQNFLKEYWKKILIFIIFTTLAAAPMLYTFFWAHPEYFESRSDSISIFSTKINQGNLAGTFLKSFVLSLAKYNFWGDQNWRHNYPPYPILDPFTGIAFLFGFIYILIQALQTLFFRIFKKIKNPEMDKYVFLIVWFFAMLAPEFMTAEGNPHALRSIGTLPVVFLFSGISFDFFLKSAERHTFLFKKIIWSLVIFALIVIGFFNPIKYFYFWANKPIVANSFNKSLTDISQYIQTLPKDYPTYIITSYNTLEKLPIYIFNSKRLNTKYLYTNQTDQIQLGNSHFTIIMTGHYDDAIASIETHFPNLSLERINESLGSTYYIFKK